MSNELRSALAVMPNKEFIAHLFRNNIPPTEHELAANSIREQDLAEILSAFREGEINQPIALVDSESVQLINTD